MSATTNSTFKVFKETLIAFSFDIGGLFAGFMVASQLDIFQISPWAIPVYPGILSAKGVISGLLSGRLSTALHLGTVHPRFLKNTKNFYKLLEASIFLTLATSFIMSFFSLVFGFLLWGITLVNFPAIITVIVSTMTLGLTLSLVTTKVAFISFKKGLDPDIIVYPIMSTLADIAITIYYILILNTFFNYGYIGKYATAIIGLTHVLLILYILTRNIHEKEFVKTLKESFFTIIFVAFIVNVTGTILKEISVIVENRREIYMVYPALIGTIGDVGSVVGSTATTKLALGLLKPAFYSIMKHKKQIFSAWSASMTVFILLAVLSLRINKIFTVYTLSRFVYILIIANITAVIAIVVVSYTISILAFQKGLDPDNFVIPVESSFADSFTSIALLFALVLVG